MNKKICAVAASIIAACASLTACARAVPVPSTANAPDVSTASTEPIYPPRTVCTHDNLEGWQKRPTRCDKAGYEKFWVCLDCGVMFSDSLGEHVIDAPIAIQKSEHATFGELTNGGENHFYVCSDCGETVYKPHAYTEKIVKPEYLKTEATANAPAYYYCSCECGAKSDTEVFARYVANIAVGKPVTSNVGAGNNGIATWGDGHRYGQLSYINDGDDMSRYGASALANPTVITIDLQSVYTVGGVTLCFYDSRVTSFKVYVSDDNSSYTLAQEFTEVTSPNDCNQNDDRNTRIFNDYMFDVDLSARYVRVEFMGNGADTFTLWELGIYGIEIV